MQQVNVNLLAVLVAAISTMVIGFIWYGPLFGQMRAKLSGIDDKKKMEQMKKEVTSLIQNK